MLNNVKCFSAKKLDNISAKKFQFLSIVLKDIKRARNFENSTELLRVTLN
jgi:hypothetical protein